MFECDAICCARAGETILSGLGFCLPEGGFLLLKGANGSGKTTLLQVLAGLRQPESGVVRWEGQPISRHPSFLQELTYIGHKNAIKRELTVEENLRFWARHYDREAFLSPALRYWGLEPHRHTACYALSAGWQRRVALARLLLSPTKLWLLDEPTNFLDQEATHLMGSLIQARVENGGVVVVASHTITSAFSTHVLELADFCDNSHDKETA